MNLSTLNRSASSPILDLPALRRAVPSAFAETPWIGMSDRYAFVPTSTIIERLATEGFMPVRAMQSQSRIEEKSDYTRHMIRFRHADYLMPTRVLGAELPELVLTNSHDGTSAYQLAVGIYRLICMNDMVVQSADFGTVSVKHSGSEDFADRIIDCTHQVIATSAVVMDRIEQWKSIKLSRPQQLALAEAATEIRALPNGITADRMLTVRRLGDAEPNLWTTSNVIQENFMAGGLRGRNVDTGRRTATRPIKSVGEDLRINKAIWTLTERMAELMTG